MQYSSPTFSGFLGQMTMTLAQATQNVKNATNLVLKLTKDVKAGLASRSDLLKAMTDLDGKIKIAKNLSSGHSLNGLGEEIVKRNTLIILLVVVMVVFFLTKK